MAAPKDRMLAFGAALAFALAGSAVAYGVVPDKSTAATPCQPIGNPLEVSVSTEKASGTSLQPKALDTIARLYNDSRRHVDVAGTSYCAEVHVTAHTSGSVEQGLAGDWTDEKLTLGAPRPEVWLPSSSIWPQLLAEHNPAARPRITIKSLAQSPLVLGMPLSKALALKAHLNGRFNWSLLQKLVDDHNVPLSWGGGMLGGGDSRWGRFHLKKDDPIASTSGLAAVVTAYLDLQRSYPTWQVGDDSMTRAFRKLEGLVSEGGYTSDGTEMMRQLANLDTADPGWGAQTSAVVVQEALLYQYNMHTLGGDAPNKDPLEPLVPFYSDAPLGMDHPFVELSPLTDSPVRNAVADDFGRFLTEDAGARREFSKAGMRDLTGRAMPGLNDLDNFLQNQERLPEQRFVPSTVAIGAWPKAAVIEKIQKMWKQTRKRAHVLVLVDESASMNSFGRIGQAKSALQKALETWTTPNDQVTLWAFSARKGANPARVTRKLMPEWHPGGASQALADGVAALAPHDDTPLFRAIREARAEVATKPSADEAGEWANVVVVLTDGDDDFVKGESASVAYSGISNIPVYSIAFGPDAKADISQLKEIASATHGGYQDATDPRALDRAFAAMVRVA